VPIDRAVMFHKGLEAFGKACVELGWVVVSKRGGIGAEFVGVVEGEVGDFLWMAYGLVIGRWKW